MQMTDPIDRSMPPAMITIASPSANSEISEMCRMLLRRLSPPKKTGFSTAVMIASAIITPSIVSSFLNALMKAAADLWRGERLLLLLAELRPERGQVALVDLLDGRVDEGRNRLAVAYVLQRLHRLVAELERPLHDGREDRPVLDRLQRLLLLVERHDQRLLRARRRLHRVDHGRAVVRPEAHDHHQVGIARQRVLDVLLRLVAVRAVEEHRQDLDPRLLAQRLVDAALAVDRILHVDAADEHRDLALADVRRLQRVDGRL